MTGWTVPGYTETSSLGAGAGGRVVAAVDDATGAPVAIKYLSAKFLDDEEFLERFRAEAELLAGLEHPNVVRFHRYFEAERGEDAEGGAALVMELVEGATLRKVLKSSGSLSPEAALTVMRGSLLGLDAAHALGIVHRDYKPANVLINGEGVSKLADFGIAERAGTEMPAIGTPSYMAPEQWEGAPAEPVTDIYAVTATFYECLTGHVPYKAETVFELEELHRTAPIPIAEVPTAVRGLVAHGLAKEAAYRPPDVAAFIAELEEAAAAEYGVDWEEQGRRDLAVFVWPIMGSAGGPPAGPGAMAEGAIPQPDDWFGGMSEGPAPDPGEPGRAWERIGRGTKAGVAAAAVALIGSMVAAVAFGSGGSAKPPVAGSTGVTLSAPSTTLAGTPTSTLAAGTNAQTSATATPTPTKTSATTSKTTSTPSKSSPSSLASTVGLPPAPTSVATSAPVTSLSPSTPSSAPSTPTPTTPTTTPNPKLTITATLTMITPISPCPPPGAQSYQVTFNVQGLPEGSTVQITYDWRLITNGGGSKGVVTAGPGQTSAEFRVPKPVQDEVIVDFSAPNAPSGKSNWVRTCEIIT